MDFFAVRRARIRAEFAYLYPELVPDIWMSARKAANLVRAADRRKRRLRAVGARVLSDRHFEFRGGSPSRQELTGVWTPRAIARAS